MSIKVWVVHFLVLGISLEAAKKLGNQFEQNDNVWSDSDVCPSINYAQVIWLNQTTVSRQSRVKPLKKLFIYR